MIYSSLLNDGIAKVQDLPLHVNICSIFFYIKDVYAGFVELILQIFNSGNIKTSYKQ